MPNGAMAPNLTERRFPRLELDRNQRLVSPSTQSRARFFGGVGGIRENWELAAVDRLAVPQHRHTFNFVEHLACGAAFRRDCRLAAVVIGFRLLPLGSVEVAMGLRGIRSHPLKRRGSAFASEEARCPPFSPAVLALFVELECLIDAGVSRGDREFRERSLVLARMLGLVGAWWTVDDVHDRSSRPCHPPSYCAHDNWHRCRAVRNALLAAVAGADAVPNVTAQGSQ
jgi:hypothetical protein